MSYIEAMDITYRYQGKGGIGPLSLTIDHHEVVALVGPNGSGKTTLGKLLVGILHPQSGSVLMDGQETNTLTLSRIGKDIGYLYQQPRKQIFATTVGEQMLMAHVLEDTLDSLAHRRCKRLLERFGLEGMEEASPYKMSYGQLQRLALASMMMNRPKFLILDEPTVGLGQAWIEILSHVLHDLAREGIGILLISHCEAFVKAHAQRIIAMEKGVIQYDKGCSY